MTRTGHPTDVPTPNRAAAAGERRAVAWVACLAAAVGCSPADDAGPRPGPAPDAEAAVRTVPDTRFRTLEGGTATLSDLRGQVVVLNFWGTWCAPCRRELPELVELDRAFRDRGVTIVGIAVDSGEPDDIRAFADDFGIRYAIWLADTNTVMSEFGAVGYPFTLLIDREGGIRDQHYGPQTVESLAAGIEPLLE